MPDRDPVPDRDVEVRDVPELPSALEIAANAANTAAIVLATLNSRSTWPAGIVGCLLFLWLFAIHQL